MGAHLLIEVSLQLSLTLDAAAQIISGMSSEDFRNICQGIASLILACKKKSA
ncbi:hypothetical protein ACXHQ0_27400 [Vibrio antiquarius]|uniref:hypothetical protein n=1 Tax=Vibrio TaxID=662 RepID=UPI000B0C1EAF|nr:MULTISPECIES: hypothetical protein [Vibrio]MCS0205549.1 hypothetical protein [Vibrio sp. HS-50-1]MCS0396888.1 hypothetical protein [Vibrio diabolicus]